VNPDVDGYNKTRNHRKTLGKTKKNYNLLKTTRRVNIKKQARWGPVFHI